MLLWTLRSPHIIQIGSNTSTSIWLDILLAHYALAHITFVTLS